MMRLYLLRHGEVELAGLRHYGHTDLALSPRGLAQARAAAAALARMDVVAVLSSDLQRAAKGAQLVGDTHGITPHADAALREIHLGVLEGMPHDQAMREYPELHDFRYRDLVDRAFPQGENLVGVAARVRPVIAQLRQRHAAQIVVMVAHNSVNRIVLADALGLPLSEMFAFRQDYGCINRIDYVDGGASVGLINWTPEAPAEPEHPAALRHLAYAF